MIGVILLVSVGLGFSNEFRAERAAEALHSRVTHRAVVVRDGIPQEVDVTALVPGDIVHPAIGAIIPADMRLLSAKDLLCDESILTGESMPVGKDPAPVPGATALGDLTSCLFMGTVIQAATAPVWWLPPAGGPNSAGSHLTSASVSPRPNSSWASSASPSCCSRWRSASRP